MQDHKIEISQRTIIFTLSTILGFWLLYQVRSIVVLLFIAFLLMTAVNPLIKFTSRYRIPTIVVMLIVYFGLITLLSTVVASLVPAVVQQTKALSQALPDSLHNIEKVLNVQFDSNVIASYFNNIPGFLVKFAAGLFSNILDILAIFFMSYYLLLERPNLHRYLLRLFPAKDAENTAESMVSAVEKAVGTWIRGELVLMLIIGLMTYVGLNLLGIPYALPLAMLAGMLELVPNIGPIMAAVPCVFIGFSVSPVAGIGALVLNILVQQLENNLIVPRVMQSATGLKPLVTLVVLLVGYKLGGIQGAVLGLPLYLAGQTIYKYIKE